jgi:hypothetical protein
MGCSNVRVDADWVQAHLHVPGVVLVEVSEDATGYDTGHIRGAVKIDLADLPDPAGCDQAGFETLLSEQGIANDDTVILYSGNSWFAVYTYWCFMFYGHQSVKILDGGRRKWERDSRGFVTEVPHRPRTAYRARGTQVPRPVTWPGILTLGLGTGVMKPAGQVLRASARVLAMLPSALRYHEDDLRYRSDGIDGRPHRVDGLLERDTGNSIGFGPVTYIP